MRPCDVVVLPCLPAPTTRDYSMLLKGLRGSGKTVLLAAIRDMAEQNGLITVRVTAKPEPTFADALIEQMTSASDTEYRRISSAQVSVLGSGAGVSFQAPEPRELSVPHQDARRHGTLGRQGAAQRQGCPHHH